jgi:type IV pilus assembly protein PilV
MVIVYSNKNGFTLVELMAALLILMVGLLGLLQAINVALQFNMKSQMDYIGAMVADQQMAQEMSKPFANVSTTGKKPPIQVQRQINLAQVQYNVTKTGTSVSPNTTGVTILVQYNYRGTPYSHSIYSMVSNYTQ